MDYASDPDFKYLAVDRKKLMREQTAPYDGKKACWVPDEKEGFIRAEIVSSKGDEITVKLLKSSQVMGIFVCVIASWPYIYLITNLVHHAHTCRLLALLFKSLFSLVITVFLFFY